MPAASQSSARAVAATPPGFCTKCGYALVWLQNTKCPECGRPFDPGDRLTFAPRPPRGWVWRWQKRVAALLLLLLLIAGARVGWLWWGWHAEQPTIARLGVRGRDFTIAPIGSQRLRWVLGERLGYLTDRVDLVDVAELRAAETEQMDFRSLTQIQQLRLASCELSSRNLNRLAGLAKLEELSLYRLTIEKPDLAFLEKLPVLATLNLSGKWVPRTCFEHIGRLEHLKALSLFDTGTIDADLQQLRGLAFLEELNLRSNPISDAGLEHLQELRSLKHLALDQRLVASPGIAKLEKAIPGLEVRGFPPLRR